MDKSIRNQYLQNAIMTETPERLMLRVYGRLEFFLDEAEEALNRNERPRFNQAMIRAQEALGILREMVDFESKDRFATSLSSLLEYWDRELVWANIRRDSGKLAFVREMVRTIADTWRQSMGEGESKEE